MEMKADTNNRVLAGTQIAATMRLASIGDFEINLKSHRTVVEGLMRQVHFDEGTQTALLGMEDVHKKLAGKTRYQGVIIVPDQLIIVRSSGTIGRCNPFERRFPAKWTTTYLGMDFVIKHLSIYEWLDIAGQLTPQQKATFDGVWCGTQQFKHADGQKATVFRFGRTDDDLVPKSIELEINPSTQGAVAFGVDRVIGTQV